MKVPKQFTQQTSRAHVHHFFYLFLFTISFSFSSKSQRGNLAIKGFLDLSRWNWQTDGVANLSGEWQFYWHELYTPAQIDSGHTVQSDYIYVPGFWDSKVPGKSLLSPAFGYATYRLKIKCPAGDESLDLKLLTIGTAYKLFVNGQQLLEVGNVSTSRQGEIPSYRPLIIHVQPVNDELNLVVQVSNFNYSRGGIWDYIKLGTHEQIESLWIKNVGIDFFIAGSFFLMGIFFVVIYFCFNKRKASLYFSIFCILLAIRPLITDELSILYFSDWSWQFLKHIEFLSFYLMVPVMCLFTRELFPSEFSRKILRLINYTSAPLILLVIVAPPYIFRYSLRPYELIIVLSAIYSLYVSTMAVRNNRPGSLYFLASFIVLFLTIINDLLYNSLLIQSTNLLYVGIFILIISQAIALSRQFFWAYAKLEVLNNKLGLINEELNRKNAEVIEANDQLTKLNSELDIFVSKTSHDLRSPLTSVVALVHIIKDEKDEAKRYQYLDMQRRTLHRLNILITDILDFSRNKRTRLNYEDINFSELLDDAMHDHQFSDNSGHIERIAEVTQEDTFISDKSRLNMILYNLISNGLKYHDKDKKLPFIKVQIKVNLKEAQITVTDNGTGISENNLQHIFTMFYQADSNFKGSGLGLYIMREAVEKLGGKIKIDSELSVGTTFTVLIPNHKTEDRMKNN